MTPSTASEGGGTLVYFRPSRQCNLSNAFLSHKIVSGSVNQSFMKLGSWRHVGMFSFACDTLSLMNKIILTHKNYV